MTHFLRDILRQPRELQRSLEFLVGPGSSALQHAASILNRASHIFLTGIGSSWHAALTAGTIFYGGGRPVYVEDTAELVHFAEIPPASALIVISRSGQSIEVVRLLEKARANGAQLIALTNNPDGELAREADLPVIVEVDFDYAISVNTYSTLALAAGLLASHVVGRFQESLANSLANVLHQVEQRIPHWIAQIENSSWPSPASSYYFLARGSSLGTAHETRLLWEEGVKMPATAMGTGAFRHGPQEIVTEGRRFGMWIDGRWMRDEDLTVARDLGRLGAQVMVVGQQLLSVPGALTFNLPSIPAEWQFLIDIIPAQLLAEHLSNLCGVNCDMFRYCSYIVEREGGLLLQ